MRRRKPEEAAASADDGHGADIDGKGENGKGHGGDVAEISLLKARVPKDFFARLCFVGIFVTENVLHAVHFELEIDTMVAPALAPLPREVAVCLHIVHVVFGLFGALFVLVSGFDTAGRTALTKGTSMMLVFMSTITWTWWINRGGVPYWAVDEHPFWDPRCSPEKRNRAVHILKNISIVGALTMLQQMAKYEHAASRSPPSPLQGLITAFRPWTLTATLAPQLVAWATLRCFLQKPLPGYGPTLMLVLSIMAVQCTGNFVNSYRDFAKGIDTKETAGDRTLVDNLVSPRTLKVLAAVSLLWWSSYFAWSVVHTNFHPWVLGLAALGTALAIGYTAGPMPLKYMGMGDLCIFICFGPGVIAYSCIMLVGAFHWEVVAFTVPVTLYVVATLHANNYRDIEADSRTGAVTLAILLGQRASRHYYDLLLLGAHASALAVGWWLGCAGVLASLAPLPQSLWLLVRIRRDRTLRTQDEETAKSSMLFGVALGLGIIIMPGREVSTLGLKVAAGVVAVLKVFAN